MKLKSQDKIYDPIRNLSLEYSPEEAVRQHWISRLQALGYPSHLITVEKALVSFAAAAACPNRRIDILRYGQLAGKIYPLLLIECKAVTTKQLPLQQLLGYNKVVQAPFFALALGWEQFRLYWQEESGLTHIDFLPTYKDLQQVCTTLN